MNTLMHAVTTLEWREPVAREPHYELRSGDDLLATLALEPLRRTLATVRTPEGTWTFLQTGILSATVYVREEGSSQDLAVFQPGFLGRGTLRFGNGVRFRWRRAPHHGGWSFLGGDGETVLTLRLRPVPAGEPWPHRLQGEVHLGPAGHSNPRVPLLAALAWYLVLMDQ
jgi:hypothetical protein